MKGHDGYYQNPVSLRIRYIKVHNGQTVRISTGKVKITEAKKVVEDHLITLFSSNPKKEKLLKSGVKNPLIPKVWDELMEEKSGTRDESTLRTYGISWRFGIEPYFGDKPVSVLSDQSEIQKYINWYSKKNSRRSFFNTGKHLRMLIKYAVRCGYINTGATVPDIEPMIRSKSMREDVGRVYTDQEYRACIDNSENLLVKTCIVIYRHMGLRKDELLKSKNKNWDLVNRTAKVWSFKNKKWREIYIPDEVLSALEAWHKERQESEFLFPAHTNPKKHIASQLYDKYWKKTKIAAGISGAEIENQARTHDWRHTFATQTARDGWPPIVACEVLDMSLEEYQKTYTHVTVADIMKLMIKSFSARGAE